MHCPRCHTPMREESLDGKRSARPADPYRTSAVEARDLSSLVWVHRCPGCMGIWFDRGEVARAMRTMQIVHAPDPPADLRATPRDPCACPACDEPMQVTASKVVEGLVFDRCQSCEGIWLDAGEIYHLADPLVALSAFVISEFSR